MPGQNRPIRHVFAEIFSLTDHNSPEVIRNYVTVLMLALEVESRIEAIPNLNHSLYSRGIRRIQARFASANLDTDLHSFRDQIKEEDMHSLEFVSDLIEGIESEKEISAEVLEGLLKTIDSFLSEIKSAKLDPDFKHFLYSNLSAVRLAIQNYKFFGAAGMRGAMAKVIGEMILDPRDVQKDPAKKSFFRKAIDTLKDINAVITFTRAGVEVSKTLHVDKILQLHS